MSGYHLRRPRKARRRAQSGAADEGVGGPSPTYPVPAAHRASAPIITAVAPSLPPKNLSWRRGDPPQVPAAVRADRAAMAPAADAASAAASGRATLFYAPPSGVAAAPAAGKGSAGAASGRPPPTAAHGVADSAETVTVAAAAAAATQPGAARLEAVKFSSTRRRREEVGVPGPLSATQAAAGAAKGRGYDGERRKGGKGKDTRATPVPKDTMLECGRRSEHALSPKTRGRPAAEIGREFGMASAPDNQRPLGAARDSRARSPGVLPTAPVSATERTLCALPTARALKVTPAAAASGLRATLRAAAKEMSGHTAPTMIKCRTYGSGQSRPTTRMWWRCAVAAVAAQSVAADAAAAAAVMATAAAASGERPQPLACDVAAAAALAASAATWSTFSMHPVMATSVLVRPLGRTALPVFGRPPSALAAANPHAGDRGDIPTPRSSAGQPP